MSISTIEINESQLWDLCVKRIEQYDAFYLSGYMKAFAHQGSGKPLLIIYQNGNDYAVNAIFVRDIAEDNHFKGLIDTNQYYDISSPYGYGGFIGDINNSAALVNEWKDFCIKNNYVSEFVRFSLFSKYYKYYGGETETRTRNVVRSLDIPIEDIWMDFKQKVRKNVKRANSYGLTVLIENDETHLEDFLRIYYGTMDRTSATEEYYFDREFFELLNTMRDNVAYFYVMYEDKIISTELVLYSNEYCYSYLGGTDSHYFEMRPNDFLKYEIIKWAKAKGLKQFVLGGGYGKDDGIFEYKKSLSPNGVVDFFIGRDIFDVDKYQMLMDMRGMTKDVSFFPGYRA